MKSPIGVSVRKNFILLLLFAIGSTVTICWILLMLLVAASGGPIFQDESQALLDVFMVFFFPVCLGAIVSVFTLIFAAVVRQKWWISIPVSIFFWGLPLIAYVTTWLFSWIVRFFYIPTPEDEERTRKFFSMSIAPMDSAMDASIARVKKMELLASEGIITQDEFDIQKQKLIADLSAETALQNAPRFFSIWQSVTAAVLGGFLAGAILISINHKRIGNNDQFKTSLIIGFCGYLIALLFSAFTTTLVTEIHPALIVSITLIYPIMVYLWHNETVRQPIASLIKTKQARNESWWLVLGISFLALVVNFLSAIPIVLIFSYFQTIAGT